MLCGLIRFLLRIDHWLYVRKHPEWNCGSACWRCDYYKACIFERMCEDDLVYNPNAGYDFLVWLDRRKAMGLLQKVKK